MFPAAFESQNRWLLCLFKHTNELALPGAWAAVYNNLCIPARERVCGALHQDASCLDTRTHNRLWGYRQRARFPVGDTYLG